MYKPTEVELAYAAGFFDGEGCVSITDPYGTPQPYLIFANNNEEIIREIQRILGGRGRVYKQKQWRVWQLFIMKSKDYIDAAVLLLPYVRVKLKQMRLGIALAQLVIGESTETTKLLRLKIAEGIKAINQKRGTEEEVKSVNIHQTR